MIIDRNADTWVKLELVDHVKRLGISYHFDKEIGKALHRTTNNSNLKGSLSRDVKGMLSLYEASFLSYEGEQILDEAKAFTSFHLRGALKEGRSNSMLLEQVNHALELPLYHRIQRLEARWYIESYAKRKDANRVLLQYCAVNASK
ncbi:hypothetical protein JHK87_016850 [Glycine soja]|nr:hypothetical protein JHK87_016850 [Glycine soja]